MARSFSRLQRLEERRNIRKAILFVMGTIVLIAITVTLGFNLLTKLFIFMGNINSTNKPVAKTDFIPPGPPVLLSSFDATNSADIILKGLAEPGSTVYLTQNTVSEGNVITSDDGTFQFGNIQLSDGDNNFSAVAIDGAGNKSLVSDKLTITYSNKAPDLKINSPNDKQVVNGGDPKVQVQGTTDPDVRLTINDRVVIIGTDGSFNYKFMLNQGDNPITITAINSVGNQSQKLITVTYHP